MKSRGEELRDEGIARAVAHANDVSAGWSERALGFVALYAQSHEYLTAEMVRMFAEARGLPKPPDGRAWAGPMLKAGGCVMSRRWITKYGKTTAIDPKVHANEVTLWRSLIFRP